MKYKYKDLAKIQTSVLILIIILGFIVFLVSKPKLLNNFTSSESQSASIALEKITSQDLQNLIQNSNAPVKLVNLWATWCGPCVEEFPALTKIRQDYLDGGVEVYFVSMDMLEDESKVREFLAEHDVNYTTYLKNEGDHQFIDGVNPDWSGALPATFLFDADGGLIKFWTGDKTYDEFKSELDDVLSTKKLPDDSDNTEGENAQ